MGRPIIELSILGVDGNLTDFAVIEIITLSLWGGPLFPLEGMLSNGWELNWHFDLKRDICCLSNIYSARRSQIFS